MNPAPRDEHAPYDSDALLHGWLSESANNQLQRHIVRVDARAIADAHLGVVEHAALVLERNNGRVHVLYAGPGAALPGDLTHPSIPVLTLRDHLLMPALVNAHTHLDLTHIGPQPHEPGDGFVRWVDMIRNARATADEEIAQHVRLGVEKSLAGGVLAVGDIAGAPAGRLTEAPARTLATSPLKGVSFLEFFGIGTSAPAAIQRVGAFLRDRAPSLMESIRSSGIRLGLQPHATNTIDLAVYRWVARAALERGLPLSTHLAETPEERQFIMAGTGPQREMLERFGIWDDTILQVLGKGNHPIEHLRPVLDMCPMLVAHVNDATDRGLETLAQTKASVAYCPRASRYFNAAAHFGPHRYRDMLQAGVNVCLGTDSIVNLDTPHRMSTLDEMRLLEREHAHDPAQLIAMATTNGASALGLDPEAFSIATGSTPAGIIAIELDRTETNAEPWACVMRSNTAPTWAFRSS